VVDSQSQSPVRVDVNDSTEAVVDVCLASIVGGERDTTDGKLENDLAAGRE
jgi:hypothetical protein